MTEMQGRGSWKAEHEFSKLYYSKILLGKYFNYPEIKYSYSEEMFCFFGFLLFIPSEIFLLCIK